MSQDLVQLEAFLRKSGKGRTPSEDSNEVVVFGGKGGVGTSLVAALLAFAASECGWETLLVENAETMGALHHHLGTGRGLGISSLRDEGRLPRDLAVPVTDRLRLISSDRGDIRIPESQTERYFLQSRLRSLYGEVDLVLIDGGATVASLTATGASEPGLYVAVTEPTRISVASLYAMIKALLIEYPAADVGLLVNQSDAEAARVIHGELATPARNFLQLDLGLLGFLPHDPAIGRAVRAGVSILDAIQEAEILRIATDLSQRIIHRFKHRNSSEPSTALSFPKRG